MSATAPRRALWWVKRDARLADNDALQAAIAGAERLLVLAIVEPSLWRTEEASYLQYHAWRQAIEALAEDIAARGGRLVLRVGEAVAVLETLHDEIGFDALHAHEEIGSDVSYRRDRAVRAWCTRQGVPCLEYPQNGVIRGLRDRAERQPVIRARLFETSCTAAPARLPDAGTAIASDAWPDWRALNGDAVPTAVAVDALQSVTEAAGRATLEAFLTERGVGYSGGISSPNTAFVHGSRLSTHIAWGTLSLRTIHQRSAERQRDLRKDASPAARRWARSLRAFQARLHWHDHFTQRLESCPAMEFEALNPAHRDIDYRDDPERLAAWRTGRTGHPMVDASIRCLAATGFLNFRMRAMLVSVACFGLELSWRTVQYPYARLFRDYEPGIHFAQVQMQAGVVGINTLRVYSPAKQLLDHDADARFVRRWLPELADAPTSDILRYETTPLGDYPRAIDLKPGATRLKDALYAIRRSDAGKRAAAEVLERHGSRLPSGARRGVSRSGRRPAKTTKAASADVSGQGSFDF